MEIKKICSPVRKVPILIDAIIGSTNGARVKKRRSRVDEIDTTPEANGSLSRYKFAKSGKCTAPIHQKNAKEISKLLSPWSVVLFHLYRS